jgi:hypothetical protein
MNKSVRAIYLFLCVVMINGCATFRPQEVAPEGTRCTNIFMEQTIAVKDLSDNTIAFLFGINTNPADFRESTTDVKMIAYGSPVVSGINKCQRWMSVKSLTETRSWDLTGWDFMTTTLREN